MQNQPGSPGGAAVSVPTAPWQARGEHDRRVQFLSRVGLFQGISPDLLAQVATALRPVSVDAGSVVCREGDPGDLFFIIEAGTLAVIAEIGDQPRQLARLGPGEFFGEMALLGQGRRTATVRAKTACDLFVLDKSDFSRILRDHQQFAPDAVKLLGVARQDGEADIQGGRKPPVHGGVRPRTALGRQRPFLRPGPGAHLRLVGLRLP